MWIANTGSGAFEGDNLSHLAREVGEYYSDSSIPAISIFHLNSRGIETRVSDAGNAEFNNEVEEWAIHIAEKADSEEAYNKECRGLIYGRFKAVR